MPTSPEEYLAKAADTLVQLEEATSESERSRLRRAHGVFMKLSTHAAEAAERAATRVNPRIVAEKQSSAVNQNVPRNWTLR